MRGAHWVPIDLSLTDTTLPLADNSPSMPAFFFFFFA